MNVELVKVGLMNMMFVEVVIVNVFTVKVMLMLKRGKEIRFNKICGLERFACDWGIMRQKLTRRC